MRLNLRFRPKKQKTGISAEPYNDRETTYSNTKEQKPQHTQAFLLTALKSNDFVKSLETEQLHKIVQSMERKSVEPKHDIIVEGQVGERLFVLASGKVQVLQNGRVVHNQRYEKQDITVTLVHGKPICTAIRPSSKI